MDITRMLESDHRKVEKLFKQAENIEDDATRKLQIFDQIMLELTIHTEIEERLFYPACRKFEQLEDTIDEALEEHAQAKALIAEIDELRDEALRLDAKVLVLKEDIEHHVEEEEGELFPKVKKLMKAEQLESIGAQAEALKQQLMASSQEAMAQLKGRPATGAKEKPSAAREDGAKRSTGGKSTAGGSARGGARAGKSRRSMRSTTASSRSQKSGARGGSR